MKKELELYIKGNYAKLEGDMLRAVEDAFESAWQEQQEKIDAVLHAIAQSELPTGCIYNNAERQAKDIKACESVGARWQYSSLTKQVNCVPNRKYVNED